MSIRRTVRIVSGVALIASAAFLAVDFVFTWLAPAIRGGTDYVCAQVVGQAVWISLVAAKVLIIAH